MVRSLPSAHDLSVVLQNLTTSATQRTLVDLSLQHQGTPTDLRLLCTAEYREAGVLHTSYEITHLINPVLNSTSTSVLDRFYLVSIKGLLMSLFLQ